MHAFTWDHTKHMATCDICRDVLKTVEEIKSHCCPADSAAKCNERGHPKLASSNECCCGQVRYDE